MGSVETEIQEAAAGTAVEVAAAVAEPIAEAAATEAAAEAVEEIQAEIEDALDAIQETAEVIQEDGWKAEVIGEIRASEGRILTALSNSSLAEPPITTEELQTEAALEGAVAAAEAASEVADEVAEFEPTEVAEAENEVPAGEKKRRRVRGLRR